MTALLQALKTVNNSDNDDSPVKNYSRSDETTQPNNNKKQLKTASEPADDAFHKGRNFR
jgi:hypothetical protein